MAPPPWPEKLPSDRQRAIHELVKGRDFANKLKVFLHEPSIGNNEGLVAAEDLALKIENSFTTTLSILNRVDFDEVSQFPASPFGGGSPCWDGRKSEDSGDSSKSSSTMKGRGCYKRRKTSQSWTRDTPDIVDDGHAWRKYGQKVILNTKYPRNYFRCTHKYEQGCQANKQIQRIQDDPPMYRTTYFGNHTCRNLVKPTHLIIDCPESNDSSVLLSFNCSNSSNLINKRENPFSMTSLIPSIKQECKDEILPNHNLPAAAHHKGSTNNQSPSSDYLLSTDDYDHAVVISGVNNSSSCTTSTHSFDMDNLIVTSQFDDDVLQYAF